MDNQRLKTRLRNTEQQALSSQGALKNLEKERSKLSEEISRLKIVEEELLLKCNMLESTDPELAVALKNA